MSIISEPLSFSQNVREVLHVRESIADYNRGPSHIMRIDSDHLYMSSIGDAIPPFSGNGNFYTHEIDNEGVSHRLIGTAKSYTHAWSPSQTFLEVIPSPNFDDVVFRNYRGPVVRLFKE